jgi:hypothetical protein
MATQVQFRRGTTTQNNAFTGAAGELTYDTDVKTLRIHDGTTPGGGAIVATLQASQTLLFKTLSTGSIWQGNAVGLQYGGTGSSLTANAGAVLYSGNSGLSLSAAGTSGQVLISGGTSAPTWVNATSLQTGTSVNATYATNVAGGSAGQLVIQQDSDLTTFITAGPSGTFLRSAGAGYAPQWATADITIGSTVIDLGSSTTSLNGLNILSASGTSHWLIPVGTTAQRPVTPSVGMIRYNTSQTTFEGYSAGAWSSLGGVTSVDKFTYIVAETSPTASNGDLDFYAENSAGNAAQQIGQWNRTNLKDYTGTIVGTQTTQNVFNVTATTVNAFGAATALTLGATSGTTTVRNNLTVTGDLTINGTTTTVNATTITVDDKNIELGSVASPTNTTADGGGITLKGATDKTINWINATGAWTSSEDFNLVTGKNYEINAIPVLTSNSVLNDSSQTSVTVAGFATTLTVGATSGATSIRNNTAVAGTLGVTGATTLSSTLAVTGATTLSGALAANGGITVDGTAFVVADTTGNTSIAGTLAVTGNTTLTGDLAVNGGDITTSSTTATVFNTTATTLNIGQAATTISLGATTGTTSIRNNTAVAGTLAVTGNSTFTGTINRNPVITLAGDLSGSVTLTDLQNGTLTATIVANAVALGTDTTGAYVVDCVAGTGISLSETANNAEGNTVTITNSGVTSIVAGSGISISAGTGAVTVTNTITNTNQLTNGSGFVTTSGATFTGDVYAPAFRISSDARLKNNVVDSKYGLSTVLQLRSVEYDRQEKHDVGLIAQEVEQIIPEFVSEDADGMKTVNYPQMVSVLIKAVQELNAEVVALKAQLGK